MGKATFHVPVGADCIDREVMTNVAANCCHPSHDQWDVQVDEDVVAITGDIVP